MSHSFRIMFRVPETIRIGIQGGRQVLTTPDVHECPVVFFEDDSETIGM